MSEDDKTLFQKIIDREIPGTIVHEDEHCVAFRDVNPGAPTHILLVPRKPIPRLCDAAADDRHPGRRIRPLAGPSRDPADLARAEPEPAEELLHAAHDAASRRATNECTIPRCQPSIGPVHTSTNPARRRRSSNARTPSKSRTLRWR